MRLQPVMTILIGLPPRKHYGVSRPSARFRTELDQFLRDTAVTLTYETFCRAGCYHGRQVPAGFFHTAGCEWPPCLYLFPERLVSDYSRLIWNRQSRQG